MKEESGFYATDQDEMLVVFGGKILVSGAAYVDREGQQYAELAMTVDGNEYEIGQDLGKETAKGFFDYHPLRLRFQDEKSIDVLIEQLQEIKKLMNKHE